MAIEFFSSFNGCGTASDILALFSYTNSLSDIWRDTSTYFGASGNSMRLAGGGSTYIQRNCIAAKTKVIGAHVHGVPQTTTINISPGRCLFEFVGPDIRIHNHITNGVAVTVGSSETPVAYASTYIPTGWHHVEVKVYSHSSAGTVDIKLNGASILAATGLNTGGADITACIYGGHVSDQVRYDNVFIASDWVGEVDGVVLYPTTDSSVAFSRSTGSDNYALVDETTGQDGDSTYVTSSNPTDIDRYGYQAVDTAYEVAGVSVVTFARKLDAGTAQLGILGRQGGVNYTVGTQTLAVAYPSGLGNNPDVALATAPDSTAWSATKLNAIEWGFENKEV